MKLTNTDFKAKDGGPCRVCGGEGGIRYVEEYVDGWPRYEFYNCYFCRGTGRKKARKLARKNLTKG